MILKRTRTFERLVAAYPAPVRELAAAARAFVREVLPDVDETVDPFGPYVGYGYGSSYEGMVCTLILSQAGVKLGIVAGADFADPYRLLKGSGKVHRHIPLKTPADLQRRGTKELVEATDRAARQRIGMAALKPTEAQ
jgi:hypothetical protein